uniref:Putative secreted protein n=1 Tax=Anopheles marajoara TaxID=58244 RepID=A0A2M4CEN2_9DIPT
MLYAAVAAVAAAAAAGSLRRTQCTYTHKRHTCARAHAHTNTRARPITALYSRRRRKGAREKIGARSEQSH